MNQEEDALELLPQQKNNTTSTSASLKQQQQTTNAENSKLLLIQQHQESSIDDEMHDSLNLDSQESQIQLWRPENIGIWINYMMVGLIQGLVRPLLNVYPLDIGATEAQQTTLYTISTLPSAFKIVFGFISDTMPILGYRRKPYMLFGWILSSLSMASLVYRYDLSITIINDNNNNINQQQNQHHPSMETLMIAFFLSGSGLWMADVMADAFVAQKAKLEPIARAGNLQANCLAARFLGIFIAAPISTYLYSQPHYGPTTIIRILYIMPWLMVPSIWLLYEERHLQVPNLKQQCQEIWNTACSRSVWQPLAFVYLFNLLQVTNAAWRQFLRSVLLFTDPQLNTLLVVSYALLYAGTMAYKIWFLHTSWRRLYQVGIVLNAIFSSLQLLLIRGHTLGLPPFWFALGDDALAEFVWGMQILPICTMLVELCPVGSEGASYAMFTTTWNSAMMLAPAISSSILLGIWDVSKATMEAGDLNGLFRLSVLTTIIKSSPILMVRWLPHGRQDLRELGGAEHSSRVGGGIFVGVIVLTLVYTMATALLNIMVPGWMGGET